MAVASRRPGEFELIDRYFKPLAATAGAFGLGDDAGVFAPRPGETTIITTDAIAAGVHFFADDPAGAIAAKALRVNLSDLAAKGAEARAYLIDLALPADWTEGWVRDFAEGLAADQARYGIALLGGDTFRASGGATVAITALGGSPGAMVRRSGARPGDAVLVSGTIGDAALGLWLRRSGIAAGEPRYRHLFDRYLYPQPRMAMAPLLRQYASAAMDVSDGLMGDLGRLCRASRVSAEVDAAAVPLSPAARMLLAEQPALVATVLTGGDDYEILATVPGPETAAFAAAAAAVGVEVSMIGRIRDGTGAPVARGADGREIPLSRLSYDHFVD